MGIEVFIIALLLMAVDELLFGEGDNIYRRYLKVFMYCGSAYLIGRGYGVNWVWLATGIVTIEIGTLVAIVVCGTRNKKL